MPEIEGVLERNDATREGWREGRESGQWFSAMLGCSWMDGMAWQLNWEARMHAGGLGAVGAPGSLGTFVYYGVLG